MKKLALLLVFAACSHPSVEPISPAGSSVLIPGASLDDVRDAVVSQMTSKGYSVLLAEKDRVTGELPIRTDWSGNYFAHREYLLGEDRQGVTVVAWTGFVDKTPAAIRNYGHYDRSREIARMAGQQDVSADLGAIRAQFLEKKGTATTK